MSKYDFLKRILAKDWQQGVGGNDAHDKYPFAENIKHFSIDEWVCLLELYCECNNIKAHKRLDILAKNIIEERKPDSTLNINQEVIIKFIKILSLSEFRIDDILLHPPQLRFKEFSHIAESIGVDPEMLRTVYLNWHDGIREKIYEE